MGARRDKNDARARRAVVGALKRDGWSSPKNTPGARLALARVYREWLAEGLLRRDGWRYVLALVLALVLAGCTEVVDCERLPASYSFDRAECGAPVQTCPDFQEPACTERWHTVETYPYECRAGGRAFCSDGSDLIAYFDRDEAGHFRGSYTYRRRSDGCEVRYTCTK